MTILGQPLKRFEDPKLITGKGSYVDDIQLPGMLHAYVLRSPHEVPMPMRVSSH